MRTLITGATGLIGKQLLPQLERPVVLTRQVGAAAVHPSQETYTWNPEANLPPPEALRDVDVIFNLAGEPVSEGRWSEEKKRRIRDSRVIGTRNLVSGLAGLAARPRVLVCASAVGYYGDRGDEELTESSCAGQGFLADVCAEWESAATEATKLGIRVVCVRIGLVLAPGGGALARMIPPFKLGIGGPLGNGKQWMPWVHIDDVAAMLLHASVSDHVRGPMNAVAPRPLQNVDFTRALARALHRPALLAVPKVALYALFGEMSEILVASQRVVPRVAEKSGYAFKHPDLTEALDAVFSSPSLDHGSSKRKSSFAGAGKNAS